jgi:hypothetical protein
MDVRREPHFRSQGYSAPGKRGAIGLLNHKLKVGRLKSVRDFLAQFRKKFGDHIVSRKSLPVFGFEEFFSNHAARVYEEVSGPRHAIELTRGLSVQNLIGANDFGIGIGKQGEIDLAAIRKVFQYGFVVVADPRELESLLFESRLGVLQLDQLPFAIGSPIRGTEKEENRAVRSFQTFQCLFVSKLVAKGKGRRLLPDRESDGSE